MKSDILRKVSQESFSFLMSNSFEPDKATYAQLEEVFKELYQVDRDVSRKCIKFFIEIAVDSGIPLSQFITKYSGTSPVDNPEDACARGGLPSWSGGPQGGGHLRCRSPSDTSQEKPRCGRSRLPVLKLRKLLKGKRLKPVIFYFF
jgi:hypothetical protein